MLHLHRSELPVRQAAGRTVMPAVNNRTPENTANMMAGFARFSYEYGKMDTHRHENEYMYVIAAHNAVVRHGMDLETLVTEPIVAGQILRPVDGEWHRFDFTSDDGYVEFLNFFPSFPPHTVNASDLNK